MSTADDTEKHRAVFLGIHTLGRERRDAAAKLVHERRGHFFGFGGDNSKFNRGVEAVGDCFVGFTLDIRFKSGHHNGEQRRRWGIRAEDEDRAYDNHAVEEKYHPCDRGGFEFFLYHNGNDIRAARAAACFKGEGNGYADSKTCRYRRENFFAVFLKHDTKIGQDKL